MRLALLLALISSAAEAQYPAHRIFRQRNLPAGAAVDGGLVFAGSFIVFAPAYASPEYAAGAGMGAECACAAVTTPDGGAVTFARAGVAWCSKGDYSLVECASGKPRVMYDRGSPNALGLLVENTSKTNIVLQNRDLSDAAWTKSASMACTKTAAGADLVANAASTCTASDANQTVLQGVTIASARRNSSLYIKRRTGTGAVSVTRDNGSTWTAITSSLSSSIYKRVVSQDEVGCAYGGCIVVTAMTAVAANPTIGVKLATSGDAVDIDLVQDEAGHFPTSPITTAGSTVARGAESASITIPSTTVQCVSWDESRSGFTPGENSDSLEVLGDTSHAFQAYTAADYTDVPQHGSPYNYFANGAGNQAVHGNWAYPSLGPVPRAVGNDGGIMAVVVNGNRTTEAASVGPATGMTSIVLGGSGALQFPPQAGARLLSNLRADPSAAVCEAGAGVNRAVRPIAIIGDSIAAGSYSHPTTPQAALQLLVQRGVYNKGSPGDNTAGCVARYQADVVGRGFTTLVWICGTNDMIGGGAPAWGHSTFTAAQVALDDAKARGMTVIPVTLLPKGCAAGWTAVMQSNLEAYNSDLLAWCTANGVTCVDAYTLMGGGVCATDGGTTESLASAYDYGDGVHPNAAGSSYLASLIYAAGP